MTVKRKNSRRTLGSDLAKADAHVIQPHEYEEIPELTDDMLALGTRKRGGRPVATDPRKLVTIRLRASVLALWRGSGAGWQTRMAAALTKRAPKVAARNANKAKKVALKARRKAA